MVCQALLFFFFLSHKYSLFVVDHSLFLKYIDNKIIVILVYVYDLVLIGDVTKEIVAITAALHHHFKIKNLGNLTYFLGLKIARNSVGLHLSQRKYTLDLLQKIDMLNFEPVATPMTHTSHLSPSQGTPLMLQPLLNTKDFLATSYTSPTLVQTSPLCSQSQPVLLSSHHFSSISYFSSHLKGNPGDDLYFLQNNNLQLCGLSWATCLVTWKCVTGYSIFLGNSLIS